MLSCKVNQNEREREIILSNRQIIKDNLKDTIRLRIESFIFLYKINSENNFYTEIVTKFKHF